MGLATTSHFNYLTPRTYQSLDISCKTYHSKYAESLVIIIIVPGVAIAMSRTPGRESRQLRFMSALLDLIVRCNLVNTFRKTTMEASTLEFIGKEIAIRMAPFIKSPTSARTNFNFTSTLASNINYSPASHITLLASLFILTLIDRYPIHEVHNNPSAGLEPRTSLGEYHVHTRSFPV